MPSFTYQGRNSQGRTVKGNIEAATDIEARVKLRAQKIKPQKVFLKGHEKSQSLNFVKFFQKKHITVKPKDLQVFSRQFATMIGSGIPIVQALEIMSTQMADPGFKRILVDVRNQLEAGKRLNECLAAHPGVFDTMYVSLIKAGEEGGVLDTILNRLAAYLEKNAKIMNKIKGAMWYPAGISIVAALVITGLLKFVIPKFEKIFASSGMKLPALTQTIVDMSHFMQDYFLFIVGGVVGGIFAIRTYFKTPGGRAVLDTFILKVPIFGPMIQKGSLARITRTMSTMLSCGVGILDALDICSNVAGNVVLAGALQRAKKAIAEGKSITQPLSKEPIIPSMVTQMIGVGEATGNMDSMFGKIADFYEEELDYAVGALTAIMEPLMMVFLGGIVAVLVVAMYLPIFNLGNSFK